MSQNYSCRLKSFLYQRGMYVFKAPPVCTAGWSAWAWWDFITSHDGWRPPWEKWRWQSVHLDMLPVCCFDEPGWQDRIVKESYS